MMKFSITATAAMGLETVLKYELFDLGYKDLTVENGKITLTGDWIDICRLNLQLRSAGRVYLNIAEFEAKSFDELFEKTRAIEWEQFIQETDRFPVSKISSKNSTLFSKSDSQSIIKKAIVDRLRSKYNRNHFPETGASFFIRAEILNDVVKLSVDTSGEGLHKRGYRAYSSQAPLRETLAASMILLSRWNPEEEVLMDPFCGSGTILIEAAMIAQNIAPGLSRYFASEFWGVFPDKDWESARVEAESQKKDIKANIYGSDIDPKVLNIARHNISESALENVFVQTLDVKESRSKFKSGKIICNPPYGERIKINLNELYADMAYAFNSGFQDWSYYILSGDPFFEKGFGKKANKNRKVFNGNLPCRIYQYFNR